MTSTATAPLRPREKEGDAPPTIPGRSPPTAPELGLMHYDAGRYVVVDKPGDVRMDGDFTHTVEKLVLAHIKSIRFDIEAATKETGFGLRFVHRLDYATSGVMLVGLTRHAASVAATQFERRTVKKCYLALVHGHVEIAKQCHSDDDGALTFDQAIADTKPPGYRMMVGSPDNPGRASKTKCYPLAYGSYKGAAVTKVRLEPHSGRRHQLRVHCAHAGMPIVGDATYIEDDGVYFEDAHFVPPRMMLHAYELRLSLPEPNSKLHGRKSGLRSAVPMHFVTKDPFCEETLEDLTLRSVVSDVGV